MYMNASGSNHDPSSYADYTKIVGKRHSSWEKVGEGVPAQHSE